MKRLLIVFSLALLGGQHVQASEGPRYSDFERMSERTKIKEKTEELTQQRERDIKLAEDAIKRQEEIATRAEGEEKRRLEEEILQGKQNLQIIRDTTATDLKTLTDIAAEDFSRDRTQRLDELVKKVEDTTTVLAELNAKLNDQFLAAQPAAETVIRKITNWEAIGIRWQRFKAKIERAFTRNKENIKSLNTRIENLTKQLNGIVAKSGYRNLEAIAQNLDDTRAKVLDGQLDAQLLTDTLVQATLAVQEAAKSGASQAEINAAKDAANLLAVDADGVIDLDADGNGVVRDASSAEVSEYQRKIDALLKPIDFENPLGE